MSKLKLLFLMMVVLMTFVSCSYFVSEPVNPKILGVVYLHHDSKSDLCYATVDTIQYTVTTVTIPDRNPRSYSKTQELQPVDGMKVTIFTSPRFTGVQAVLGEQDVDEIEALYRENHIGLVILFVLMVAFFIAVIIEEIGKRKKCHGNWPWLFLDVGLSKIQVIFTELFLKKYWHLFINI